ncbi:glycosyltransferase [Algoriphagus lutimaris]|uniref:glycosyltransferase n=1 Tax=Algoriphagus lutimaris TaxID=613197 RepID=UPI00196B3497|nr:glycosyltransferase [Algoriphagus lutimaris]MBN3518690.1 glycosyltransferase [Algoriphagus lutimaris]
MNLCVKSNVLFAYHESSICHPKNHLFYKQLEIYGFFLISAKEKENYILENYPDARYFLMKQWIYLGQSDFLSISPSKNNVIRFGSIGRLDLGKNFILIMEALKILNDRKIKVEFVLYGDGPELENLKKSAVDWGLNEIVSFKGAIPFEDRYLCFEDMDVFIMTSNFEGGPLVILEAMASGKPIISTIVGDVPNRVFEDINGYSLPPFCSASDVANEMEKYIFDYEKVEKHGRNSREVFLKEFEKSKSEELFKTCIMNILDSKKV